MAHASERLLVTKAHRATGKKCDGAPNPSEIAHHAAKHPT